MTATFGKIDAFEEAVGTWEHYTERLGHYFDANNIGNTDDADKAKRKSILLSVCGGKVYKLMCDLLVTAKPGDKTYDELVAIVQGHYQPKPSEIVERYKFHNRFRSAGETVSDYVASLRHLAEHCNYGETLDNMLRDRIVCGINEDRIQRRLLSESELTFKKAFDIAYSMELAKKNVIDLQQSTSSKEQVNKLQSSQSAKFKNNKQFNKGHQSSGSTDRHDKPCWRCGGKHKPHTCRFKDYECYKCGQKGHIRDKCPNKEGDKSGKLYKRQSGQYSKQPSKVHMMEDSEDEMYMMYHINHIGESRKPYHVKLQIGGKNVDMEIDTGAGISVLSETTFRELSEDTGLELKPTQVKLRTYTGASVPTLGECVLTVCYRNFTREMLIVIVKGNGPNLMGRDWLGKIKLNWAEIFKVSEDHELQTVLDKHKAVFAGGLGKVKNFKAKIYVDQNEKPRYFKARPVPYALREKIETELDRLVQEGTIEPVEMSEWATPIVPIVKSDSTIRICGDYKVTVNQVSKLDNYPIPKTEDLYASLGGGAFYSKLDLSQAYQQLELDTESKPYTTINTHKGLFCYNRLPYGISSAPGIFQRTMENILQGVPQVIVRVDDILVAGRDRQSHIKNLELVLTKLENAGIHLKKSKCFFMKEEVEYLGHRITGEGMQPIEVKVRAIKDAPAPRNVKELQAFLGMLNYYACYLPNISTVLAPLHMLLAKETDWKWGKREENAFVKAKELLQSDTVLVHYDPKKKLVLSCDASPYGLGAVLSHVEPDGKERPIAYASRSLAPAEKNYSQLDKEGAALIFGVKKFHQYLYGRTFTIYTDHKPLLGIFKTDRAIPTMASARIQRWALLLAAYEYDLIYRPGTLNANADGLSRLPLSETVDEVPVPGEMILMMDTLNSSPVTFEQVQTWTKQDPTLQEVIGWVYRGWGEKCPNERLKPYHNRRHELNLYEDVLLWGNRVVIPTFGRASLLDALHEGHPGIVKMKSLARGYVWWPGIDAEIEERVKCCESCQLQASIPAMAPLHSWDWPSRPWSRVHVDYAGPFLGHMYLVVIDAYSKWVEILVTNSSTSAITIERLRCVFAQHGLPEMLVSDNGPCFVSEEFSVFMSENGIKHVRTSPHHPASNGLAERAVRGFKEGMKKQQNTEGSLDKKLCRYLLAYRSTPQTTTGLSPAELLFNRRVRTKLDLVRPEVRERVQQQQLLQKKQHDQHTKERHFAEGDSIFAKNFYAGPKWKSGEIVSRNGPVSYTIKGENGTVARRHVDKDFYDTIPTSVPVSVPVTEPNNSVGKPKPADNTSTPVPSTKSSISPGEPSRRPQRPRKPPSYLKEYVRD
ncbi:uncharacterized protein K02A2.6-like isoform X2 [Mizuhopecten yessoensis]|uniref:uncharacterized protein K02A2.6-like isoform X2 n=2 Tax=Mizuhopecten yessoensis TaxID=6573 RepID=UPI000B45CD48|nr:uncharacterized protein K02A2.6-like isoform X2 [Mizuhopecten yessoensis]